jgi:hypothetical protein
MEEGKVADGDGRFSPTIGKALTSPGADLPHGGAANCDPGG